MCRIMKTLSLFSDKIFETEGVILQEIPLTVIISSTNVKYWNFCTFVFAW